MVIFRGDDQAFRDPYYLATLPNGKLRFHIETASGVAEDLETTNPIPLGQFIHVAGTFDAVSGEMRIYANGALAVPIITTAVRPRLQLNNSLNPGIGIGNIGSTSTVTVLDQIFNGLIDEAAIYNRALSASEITSIFDVGTAGKCKPTATVSPSGQVAWFAGDGNATDIAGTNNGTLEDGAGLAVGKVGQSFNFTAQNQSVSIPNNPALFPPTALSIEAWVNPSTYAGCSSHYRILHTLQASSRGYATLIDCASQKLQLLLLDSSGTTNQIGSNATIPTGTFTHIATTWDGSNMRLYINGVLDNTAATTISAIGTNSDPLRIGNGITAGFKGQIDEVSLYNRALTDAEITSIVNAGLAGKLKETTTTGTTAMVGDATVTYTGAATRRTHEIPLEEADMPALPTGMAATGLLYDIATDVIPSGTTDLCFNLQAFAGLSNAEFLERRILHLEGGSWANRTISRDFTTKSICARVLSLSPFVIVDSNPTPTAASVSVGGRVVTADGRGIGRARVSITDAAGSVQTAVTNPFGYYKFDQVEVGATYLVSVRAKQHQFENPTRTVNVVDELTDVDFTALPPGESVVKASDPSSFPSHSRVLRRSSRAPTY